MNFDFITESIAVGQKIDSKEFADALSMVGITHVLNLFAGDQEKFWPAAFVRYIPQEDDGTARTREQISAAISYAFAVLADGGKLYIHCQWGIGRAPATCYAILRSFGFSTDFVQQLICSRRPRCADSAWKQYVRSIEEALRSRPWPVDPVAWPWPTTHQ